MHFSGLDFSMGSGNEAFWFRRWIGMMGRSRKSCWRSIKILRRDWMISKNGDWMRRITWRGQVLELRKKRESPVFSRMWSGLSEEGVPGPVDGLRFVVEGDPLFAWRGGSESWWRLRMCDRA